ncbi:MAG: TetR family transcriptional regulator [Actinomycetota bacterium]
MARPSGRDIRHEVLDEATQAIRSGGVTGFSYGDLAARLGIRAPSIHHHFQRKGDLIAEAAARYRQDFRRAVDELDDTDPLDRLRSYSRLFLSPTADGVLCLCGAAVAGWDDLNDDARDQVAGFFRDELDWVHDQFRMAAATGAINEQLDLAELAATFVAALEGALMLARSGTSPAVIGSIPDLVVQLAEA